jgi:cytoskeletal protein RodZ
MMRKLLTAAAVTAAALLATHGVASAHEAEASCIEGTYTVTALTAEPGFGWVDNGDGTWTATWGDGFTVTGDAPEACLTPATSSPAPTSSLPATTTTVTPSVTTAEPGTTAPTSSTAPAGSAPSGPTSFVASSKTLPATGFDETAIVVGLILFAGGAAVTWIARRKP